MQKSSSLQRLQLYSQSGGRRSSLEDFQPHTTSHAKFDRFKTQKYKNQNVNIISLSELQNIKERSLINHHPDALKRQKDREQLKELSGQRVQNWPNTLQAIRKKRDQWRFEKFEREETQRRLIDAEEKKYQDLVKKQVLDKSNKQIYMDQDRIRSFQSKMLLSDALQEREEQIAQKEQLRFVDKLRNEMYDEQMKEIIRQQEEEEYRKQAEIQEKKRQTAKILKEQHDEMKNNFIKRLQEEKIEGEIKKLHCLEALEKAKQEELKKIQQHKQLNKEVEEGNKVLQVFKQKEKQRELQEEQKIQEYANKKFKMEEMKKIRSEQRFKEKQEQLQKLQDAQYKRLQELREDENQRINKQIEEAEIKAENEEKRKKDYRDALIKKIDTSMKQAILKREQEKKQNIEDDEKFKQFWVQKNIDIQKREEQEKREAYQRNKDLQQYHQGQIEKKTEQLEDKFINEIQEQQRIKGLIEQEDQNYDEWTKRALLDWKDNGKNIYPLVKQLKQDQYKRVL